MQLNATQYWIRSVRAKQSIDNHQCAIQLVVAVQGWRATHSIYLHNCVHIKGFAQQCGAFHNSCAFHKSVALFTATVWQLHCSSQSPTPTSGQLAWLGWASPLSIEHCSMSSEHYTIVQGFAQEWGSCITVVSHLLTPTSGRLACLGWEQYCQHWATVELWLAPLSLTSSIITSDWQKHQVTSYKNRYTLL